MWCGGLCFCGVVVPLWRGGAFVLSWCFCGVVVFLVGVEVLWWWCGGGVVVWWSFWRGGVAVFLVWWWCCGVVVWCCGGWGGGQLAVDTTWVSQYARAALQDARKSKKGTYPELP